MRVSIKPSRPEDDGKFVAIDVETGDYEIDEDDYGCPNRKKPGSRQLSFETKRGRESMLRNLEFIKKRANY